MRQLGPYTVVRELGRGGMGAVYVARDARLGREVALKVMHPRADPRARERFLVEGRAQARVSHPNLVAVHEVGEEHGVPFIAMSLVAGESLKDRVAREGPLELALAVALVRDVARALHVAHEAGVLHRDVKPDNVLLSEADGRPLLTDFGLARDLLATGGLTATGEVLGTPEFMSPEQADGQGKRVDRTADVYSLGATLYFVLTGQPPFEAESLHVLLVRVLSQEPPRPSRRRPEVPPALDALCRRAMAKEPGARHPSAAALADDLERCLDAPTLPSRRLTWAVIVALLAVVAAAAGAVVHGRPPSPPVAQDPPTSTEPRADPAAAASATTATLPPLSPWSRVWRRSAGYPLGPRAYLQAAYDPEATSVVVFATTPGDGGSTSNEADGWLHAFDGTWSRRAGFAEDVCRAGAAFTFDPARRACVLFGGCHPGTRTPSDLLSLHRHGGWETASPRRGPRGRRNAMLAWDPEGGGRVLLHGGVKEEHEHISDLWAWDGRSWTDLRPATHPSPPRDQAAMVFDTRRRRLVLYGGGSSGAVAPCGDLWEWDGIDWQERRRLEGEAWPPPVQRVPLIFDGERSILVARDGGTWTWDGDRWEQPAVAAPTPRERHALAWDARRRVAVLVGGETCEDDPAQRRPLEDTWELVPRTARREWSWSEVQGGPRQPEEARTGIEHAMTHDPTRRQVLVFGGTVKTSRAAPVNDLWGWDGASWTRHEGGLTVDPPRVGHALAFDEARGALVLHGGAMVDETVLSDTWVWDGEWRLASRAGPPRTHHALVWDPDGKRLLLHGGHTEGGPTNDTWTWDGERWVEVPSEARPSPMSYAALAYDAPRRRLVRYGGSNGGDRGAHVADELWEGEWDGSRLRWSQPHAAGADRPPPLKRVPMVHDGARALLLDGARLWAWDGGRWTVATVERAPGPREGYGLAWDAQREVGVLFGGHTDRRRHGDLWELWPR